MTLLLIPIGIIIALQIANIIIQILHKRQNRREWAAFADIVHGYTLACRGLKDDQITMIAEDGNTKAPGARLGPQGLVVTSNE